MDKKQLIEFLKKNLHIEVETGAYDVTVRLYLGDILISQSKDDLNFVRL